jgi:hypothetical protein
MSQHETSDPSFTAISSVLAARLPTEGVPEEGVASAFRDTLYAARDRGILEPVATMIEQQGEGDAIVSAMAQQLRGDASR